MTRTIAVSPAAFGWTLQIDAPEGALQGVLVFASGALAESAARRLAHRLAAAGEACDVLIYLRDGSLAGTLRSTPLAPVALPRNDDAAAVESAAAA
jgi:hypothetical protein